jgi:hypothetical protein
MQSHINRITDILRRDDGISGAMHYTEQISWILFLKFLDDFEQRESDSSIIRFVGPTGFVATRENSQAMTSRIS